MRAGVSKQRESRKYRQNAVPRSRIRAPGGIIAVATALLLIQSCSPAPSVIVVNPAELEGKLLLQTSYEQDRLRSFDRLMTSRSRIVSFLRDSDSMLMLESGSSTASPRLLARIPIRGERDGLLLLDFNAGFNKIFLEEDRTGEDYYGRVDQQNYEYFNLSRRRIRSYSRSGPTLVLEQHANDEHNSPVIVHYYLRPYRPDPAFKPFEMKSLEHFGLYETYPQQIDGRTVLYATKFSIDEPIVFALSSTIPLEHRQAARDGVLYWNRAFGRPIVRVIDAPDGILAPDPRHNLIQWEPAGSRASTSHIQTDPLTGEILHAHIFIKPMPDKKKVDAADYDHHLRYLVAHEVGHALGLRHNFASGPATTVMNYFSYENTVRLGRSVIARGSRSLAYDTGVIRNVYLDEPSDLETLPAFCTDHQLLCGPLTRGRRTIGAAVPSAEEPAASDFQ